MATVKLMCQVVGAKAGKGDFNGVKYDYTKLNVLLEQKKYPLDSDQWTAGVDVDCYSIGDSGKRHTLNSIVFPCTMELELDITTKGNVVVGYKVITK